MKNSLLITYTLYHTLNCLSRVFSNFFLKKLVTNRIGTVSCSNGWGLHRCLFRKSHPPLTSIIIADTKANCNRQTAQIWDFFRIKVCAVCLLKNSVGYGIMEISPVACDNGRFEKKNPPIKGGVSITRQQALGFATFRLKLWSHSRQYSR